MSTQLSRAEDRIKVLDDQLSHLEEYLKESRILAYNLGLENAAKLCDSDSGRYFLAIEIAQGEQAKHILGAKSACAMSLAAGIREMKKI